MLALAVDRWRPTWLVPWPLHCHVGVLLLTFDAKPGRARIIFWALFPCSGVQSLVHSLVNPEVLPLSFLFRPGIYLLAEENMDGRTAAISKPIVLITNDDGIDAPGLRFLVDLLVATDRYRVLVCAPAS